MTLQAYIVGGAHNGTTATIAQKQQHLQLDGARYSRIPDWMTGSELPVFSPSTMGFSDVMRVLLERNLNT
jgi:hypothetical protein